MPLLQFAEYPDYDAIGLADLIRRRQVSAREVAEAAITCTEILNPHLNAVVERRFDSARARANVPGMQSGPLSGVPFLIKDGLAEAGRPAPAASRLLAEQVSRHDAELLRRYRNAGLTVIGRSNMPEWGLSAQTAPRAYGPCRNPWDPARHAGGSSGGAASAVAARMVPLAHGGDGAGSIRIPAACCGLFGLKPTRGRVPVGPDVGEMWGGLVAQHVITRSVRDSAAVLDATAGPEIGCPYTAPTPPASFVQGLEAGGRRLRIAWSADSPLGGHVAATHRTAVERAAQLCAEMGHSVEPARPVFDAAAVCRAWMNLVAAEVATDLAEINAARATSVAPEDLEAATWLFARHGATLSGEEVLGARRLLQRESRRVAHFFADFDLFLMPSLAQQPPLIDGPPQTCQWDGLESYCWNLFAFTPFTPLANVTGQPAMSVPLYHDDQNLPVGVHFMAPFGEESTLLSLAARLEEATNWTARKPAMLKTLGL